jgi:hypothetical protein
MYDPKKGAVGRMGLILQSLKSGQHPKLEEEKQRKYSCLAPLTKPHRCSTLKVKLFLCFIIFLSSVYEGIWESRIITPPFLTSALDGG